MAGEIVPVQAKARKTEISYCPEMGIYLYKRADGEEFLFDNARLVESIDGYMKGGAQRMAEFMSLLTGFARQFPHKVVSFDENGNVNLSDLVKPELFDDGAPDPEAGTPKG